MANNDWVHRTTRQYISGDSPASMAANFGSSFVDANNDPFHVDWIFNPDLSAVVGQPTKYWVITGDLVALMTEAGRAAVDDAELSAARDALTAQLDQVENVHRAFMNVVLDEVNLLRSEHGLTPRTLTQLRNAVRDKLGT